eukprot:jgi/Ulvmu1/3765/UM175_0013.1
MRMLCRVFKCSRSQGGGCQRHLDSTLRDIGGHTQVVGSVGGSLVLNRTSIVNAVQQPLDINFHPLALGGPNAGQFQGNALIFASGEGSNVLLQDVVLENVTAANVFSLEESGYIAVDNNTGAPTQAYRLEGRADVPLPSIGPVPDGRLEPLGPADPWWKALRQDPPPPPVSASAPPEIAAVYTAEEFQRAYQSGVRDIELSGHIDTRTLDPQSSRSRGGVQRFFGSMSDTTRSIRV